MGLKLQYFLAVNMPSTIEPAIGPTSTPLLLTRERVLGKEVNFC